MSVIDAELAAFIEGPSAQNLAGARDGAPTVGRAWGLRVDRGRLVRAVVGAESATAMHLRAAGRIAVLIVDLATYRSVQMKGTVTAAEAAGRADQDVYTAYVAEFRAALLAAGRTTPLDAALPASIVAVTIDVDATFDQTPGPDAGRRLTSAS
jgi:hypothetical protein